MEKTRLSRREFLRTSAAAAAGIVLASCSQPAAETPAAQEATATSAPQAATATTAPQEATATPVPEVAPARESAVLASMVSDGQIPPLAERLPKDPRICPTIDGIGKYSDTLQVLATSPGAGDIGYDLMPGMFGETNKGEMFANFAKGFEISDDAQTYTFHIREGLKWSDGEPFTTEDVTYWYNDDATNKEISPSTPGFGWTVAGEFCTLDVVDDYTFKVSWPVPNRPLTNTLMFWAGMWWNFASGTPAHYMKQYHKDYNPKVEDEATAEGFDTWVAYYGARKNPTSGKYAAEKPALAAWLFQEQPATHTAFRRNPFYWGTDSDGNQLPYFDAVRSLHVQDVETYNLKIVAGEADYASGNTTLNNLPLYMDGADQGGYVVHKFMSPRGSDDSFCFNHNSQDEVLARIFQDPRWSQAMSYAINRQEVQDVVFLGTGVIRQAAPNPDVSYFKKEWEDFCVEYSPDKANQLLDEMGLDQRDADGYRLRPDGQTLSILVTLCVTDSPTVEVTQVVAQHWDSVGVKVDYQVIERTLLETRGRANEIDVAVWHTDRTNEARGYVPGAGKLVDDYVQYEMPASNEWFRWYNTKGEQGVEPPEEWKQHYKDIDDWFTATNEEDYVRLAQKIFDFLILDQLRVIGTVGFTTWPVITKNTLGNFPAEGYMGDDVGGCRSLNPEAWFRKEA
jgi:peptide/nickel transport system substrate-binding protein